MTTAKRIALGVFASIVLFIPLKLYWAERQVTAFCNDVAIGASVEELQRTAEDRGLKIRTMPAMTLEGRPYPAKLLAWEGFAFGRWFCEISHTNGKADSKRVVDLD